MFYNGIKEFNEIKTKIISDFAGVNYKPDFIFFCVDFDGTLVKICKNPLDVYAPEQLKSFLKTAGKIKNVIFCVITGRELKDIQNRVGICKNIVYSGNHGFEIKSYYDSLKIDFLVKNTEKYIPLIKKALNEINKFRKTVLQNLIVEDKKFSISMHYRLLNYGETKILKKYVKNLLSENPLFDEYLHIIKGKKILEIRPDIDWNKGRACDYITETFVKTAKIVNGNPSEKFKESNKINILRVNIGDDITDETMFSDNYNIETGNMSATVKTVNCVIGKKKSFADIYLDGYKYTPFFIENILSIFNF